MKYTEEDLIEGCKANNRKYQHALYERYSGKMFAVCLRYAKDRMQAEDIMQEAFVRVFTYMHQYTGGGSFEGWIRKIMVNTALQHLRKENSTPNMVDVEETYDLGEEDNTLSLMAAEDIMMLINKLPSGYRMVFNLYVMEEYSHKEIADELGISEGTSKSQLARARTFLKKLIEKNEDLQPARREKSFA